MKELGRALVRALCLVLMATGVLAGIAAAVCCLLFGYVLFGGSAVDEDDRRYFSDALLWLAGSVVVVGLARHLIRRTAADEENETPSLVRPASGRSDTGLLLTSELTFLVAIAVWVSNASQTSGLQHILVIIGAVTLLFVSMHLRILFHEMGHLTAARLVKLHLLRLQVGIGPMIKAWVVRNQLRVEWRLIPSAGLMSAFQLNRKHFRIRETVFILGGPLVDVALLWLVYVAIRDAFGGLIVASMDGPVGVVLVAFFCWTAVSAIGGIIPQTIWVGRRRHWSDGYLLLRLWTTSPASYESFLFETYWKPALQLLEANDLALSGLKGQKVTDVASFYEQRSRLASRLLPNDSGKHSSR